MKKAPARSHYQLRLPPFTERLPAPVFFRTEHMPAYATYPALSHQWGEFVYSYSGITEVNAGSEHTLAPPHLGIWIPAGVEHTGFNHQATVHCSVYISPALCTHLPDRFCAVTVSPLVRSILEQLRDASQEQHAAPANQRLLRVLVDQLATCSPTGSYIPATSDPRLDAVLHALRDNPADNRPLSALAIAAHMSERTLVRHCRRELGMSLTEWRQRLRIVSALPLLHDGRSVESVALEMGYATSSAFIAMYRRVTGTSPKRSVTGQALRQPSSGQ